MSAALEGYAICSGCSCCNLSCPVWRQNGDLSLTAHGRFKALQWGAGIEEVAESIDACLLCGACEPVCPESSKIVDITLAQRAELNHIRKEKPKWYPEHLPVVPNKSRGAMSDPVLLLPGSILSADEKATRAVIRLLGGKGNAAVALYDGHEIAADLEAGLTVPEEKIERFISPLSSAKTFVLTDGGFIPHLRKWMPGKEITGLGEALLKIEGVRKSLGPEDLYIIESRSYHLDYRRLVTFYDQLRRDTGVEMNLDLNRAAIPTGASSLQGRSMAKDAGVLEQARWILKGRKGIRRIVVEDMADMDAFRQVTDLPVVHIGLVASEILR